MKTTAFVVVAVVLGAVTAGLTTTLLVAPEPFDAVGTPEASSHARARLETEVLARLEQLGEENQQLRERLAAVELRRVPTREAAPVPLGGYVSRDELADFMEEVRESLAAASPPADEPAAFKSQVAEALQAVRKDERIESVKKSQEKQAARLDQRVERVTEWLGLDAYQAREMRAILAGKDERDSELVRLWEEGVDEELLGEMKRTHRELFVAAIERTLTAGQMETFRTKFTDTPASKD